MLSTIQTHKNRCLLTFCHTLYYIILHTCRSKQTHTPIGTIVACHGWGRWGQPYLTSKYFTFFRWQLSGWKGGLWGRKPVRLSHCTLGWMFSYMHLLQQAIWTWSGSCYKMSICWSWILVRVGVTVNVYYSLLWLSVGNDRHKHVTDCDCDAANKAWKP